MEDLEICNVFITQSEEVIIQVLNEKMAKIITETELQTNSF